MATKMVDTAHWAAFGIMDVGLATCEASSVETGKARAESLVVCSTLQYWLYAVPLVCKPLRHRLFFSSPYNGLSTRNTGSDKSIQAFSSRPQQDNSPNGPPIRPEIIRVCHPSVILSASVLSSPSPRLVNAPSTDELIRWSDTGDSFFGPFHHHHLSHPLTN